MNFGNALSSLLGSAGNGAVVGIDIGSSAVKVVELQEREGVITLTNYGELQLGPYVNKSLGESVTLTDEHEQTVLVDVLRESAIEARSAVFAMPLASSFVTNVSVEADEAADLSALIRVEARKVIPASLSEVTLDWAEVETVRAPNVVGETDPDTDTTETEDTTRRDVLVAAIQNAALSRFKTLMKFAGLEEPPTEIECFSSIRALFDSEEENMAIIDIGADASKLYITHKGLMMRMHRVRAGGAVATRQIAQSLGLSFLEAEELKYGADTSGPQFAQLKRAHNESYTRAFREFGQVIREYERKTGVELPIVHLAGGGALFPGLDKLLNSTIQKEVALADPFSRVAYPAFMEDTMTEAGPLFVVALGAALRQFE